jgi:hypothetical protein
MRRLLSAAMLILLPALARASCIPTSGTLALQKIRIGDPASTWVGCVNNSLDLISINAGRSTSSWSTSGTISVSTITGNPSSEGVYIASATRVGAAGGLSVDFGASFGSATVKNALTTIGTSTVRGNAFSVGGSSFTVAGGSASVAYGLTAGSLGLGGSPSGTRKFQVYFNANNNSPSYGDGAVRYLDSVNGVGFECGALYGGSQPSWCQSGNDGMGSKKPFVFQPDGSNVGIRTLSPATTAALEVAGPVSVGGSGNTQYSLQASSGASFGSDIHVTGTLEATKLKGDGSQLTGIGGGGTVTTQGSPAAGQVAVFQAGTVISSSPISVNGTGAVVIASTAIFTISPSSNTAPTANALYSMFIPKMAAIFDQSTSSVTTYGAINVTSATWVGTGVVRFNLVTPMSVHHMCICEARNLNAGTAATVCNPNYKPNGTSVEIINETVT